MFSSVKGYDTHLPEGNRFVRTLRREILANTPPFVTNKKQEESSKTFFEVLSVKFPFLYRPSRFHMESFLPLSWGSPGRP